ncbi:MAG: DUF4114 domain-containing protein [Proteobacteria bacterium]|nr:DUF4114 domain-containing protein [Pseudomonadota bacterium]
MGAKQLNEKDKNMARLTAIALAAAAVLTVPAAAEAAPVVYPNPGTEAPDGTTEYSSQNTGTVKGFFTGSTGSFTVFGGVKINGVDRPYALNSHTSVYGDVWDFGPVSVGDEIMPYIYVQDTDTKYYTLKEFNGDGVNHVFTSLYGGDSLVPAGTNFAFEDLPGGGDFNYQDYGFVVKSFAAAPAPAVPEPATWLMMIVGFGALGGAMRRRTSMSARIAFA